MILPPLVFPGVVHFQELVTRIEGEFRHGMPHGEVTVWYGKDKTGTKNGIRGQCYKTFCVRNLLIFVIN